MNDDLEIETLEDDMSQPEHAGIHDGHERRAMTIGRGSTILGSIAGSALAVIALFGILNDWWPAKASDLEKVRIEVAGIKNEVATIGLGQQETLELQLMRRLQELDDLIIEVDDVFRLTSLRTSRDEIDQRLTRARNLIKEYRSRK